MFKFYYKYTSILLSSLALLLLSACVDDLSLQEPEDNLPDLSDVPKEITDGYSVTFQVGLEGMAGENMGLGTRGAISSLTGQDLYAIQNFVDLEKLRILFFTCLDDTDYIDPWGNPYVEGNGPKYHNGKHDLFLFESKSRWVSILSTAESSTASWQVTTPIFNLDDQNDDYNWTRIREILIKRPFKIVILANRPEQIRYSDFDGSYGTSSFYFGNKGPYWAKQESDLTIELFDIAESKGFNNVEADFQTYLNSLVGENAVKKGYYANINDLHHCQWDPVYTNKNNYTSNNVDYHYYDFIIKNYTHGAIDAADNDVNTWIRNGRRNAMGAISAWTKRMTHAEWKALYPGDTTFDGAEYSHSDYPGFITNTNDKNKPLNFYFFPDQDQGIPMYGVQQYEALQQWKEGTPLNLSVRRQGDNSSSTRNNISLLRSLARIDLIISKSVGTIKDPMFMYSNVFGRCEPMDVATPTDQLWNNKDHGQNQDCEWFDIYNYGPLMTATGTAAVTSEDAFLSRNAWFYGAWKHAGWDFNKKSNVKDEYFTNFGKPSPRIFNPCIQRNGYASLDLVQIEDDNNYHYVVYTGERNVNDPSNFSDLRALKAELAYFRFTVVRPNNTQSIYCFAINAYDPNSTIFKDYRGSQEKLDGYKETMGTSTATGKNYIEWNYPIMRNHMYSFNVLGIDNKTDTSGLDIRVVDSENRETPLIEFF